VDQELELEAFGGAAPSVPWDAPQALRYEIALCEFEARMLIASEVDAVVDFPTPKDSLAHRLETQLWNAERAARRSSRLIDGKQEDAMPEITFRLFRAELRREALARFELELRERILRGDLERDTCPRGFLHGYLFGEARGYEKVLRERLAIRRGPQARPLEIADDHRDEIVESSWADAVRELSPHEVSESGLRESLRILDDVIAEPQFQGQPGAAEERAFGLQELRSFLHGLVRDAHEDVDRLSFGGPTTGLFAGSKALAKLKREDPDGYLIAVAEARAFVRERGVFLAGIEHDGVEQSHLDRLLALRRDFGRRPIHHPEYLRRDFGSWLTVALVEREHGDAVGEAPYDGLTAEEIKGIRARVGNLKNHLLRRGLKRELKARRLDPDDFPFLFRPLRPLSPSQS